MNSLLARFQAISDNDKSALVRKLMENGTPNFDFFYLTGLSVIMATLGLLLDSASIIIGSMLIAPLMYPILGVALGLVMSNGKILKRSFSTLLKALGIGLILSCAAAFFFGQEGMYHSFEILNRTEPTYLHLLVAVAAGAAVAFALAQPEWSEAIPGIAISVALIPPLATIGIGIAALDFAIIKGSSVILLLNLLGIIGSAAASFMMMNLYQKQHVAQGAMEKADKKMEQETKAVETMVEKQEERASSNT
ncbi:TIGR00341 family protein [Candidatus Parcubacteria bacterium]|uniref:TIGR00341 family protein n=1 Tax=Candidatus Kaiserbacteria bacterium CG10_big_fil_rev_8_21_14_0_10_47_16 TaxID=1974608 RepID=A0A2H0UD95_9BACT|nr:TIGR00341 family protein [Candidatus Parcubacteria bacterium]PIR84394.1 MAG: TIGR00341 family protein [Candidatus Kaiserbacteria bacterium CG10_big_fil_rev_8_21_14_0_10_47_16]